MAACKSSLLAFIEEGWKIVEPKTPFCSGWHLEAICDHLQALHNGQIQDLLINIPPRHMKSLAVSVFFPAWEWITEPSYRYVCSSYAEALSKRDSVKCRRLIQSLWYQARWGGVYHLTSDQNEKLRFENNMTGMRLATSVDGLGTGEGGDRIMVDDPHNVKDGNSPVKRTNVIEWWDETMSTRLNDENTGAKIIIMQRVHERDLSGHVLAENHGYTHLCLPARYEGKNRIVSTVVNKETGKPWTDKRTKRNEPLWGAKFGEKELKKREKKMSSYAIAGQHQQRPAPRGGGMFEVVNFKLVKNVPGDIIKSVRYWDKAGTEDGGKHTAGVLTHLLSDGSYCIADVIRGQWEAPKRERRITQTTQLDGPGVHVWVEQEPGSGGKESARNTIKKNPSVFVKADKVTGDKETRAEPYSCQVEGGNVYVLIRDWTQKFLDEHENFPAGEFSDQVDAASGAHNKLTMTSRAGAI